MKIIDKKLLDELIRLTKKYWETGDVDWIDARIEKAKRLSDQIFNNTHSWLALSDFISGVVRTRGLKPKAENGDIYSALAVLGYEVAENTEGEE
jgi:hypothetical protein